MSGYEHLNLSNNGAEVEIEGEQVEIDQDVYGAAVFSITYDFFEMFTGKEHDGLSIRTNVYRVSFVITLLFFNYVFQLGLLHFVYVYVAKPSVHEAQTLYRDYHRQTFRNGTFSWSLWDKWDWNRRDGLCGLAFSLFPFMYMILCLWWILMLTEVRKTDRLWRRFRQLRYTGDPNLMVVRGKGTDNEPNLIVGLTPFTRFFLYFVLLIPKYAIAILLWAVGTVWLVASDSFADLILNSVSLEFIICIDEILFEGLLPESVKKDIEQTRMVVQAEVLTGDPILDTIEHEKKVKAGYHRSTFYLFFVLLGVYLYLTYGQELPFVGVFPGYKNDAFCTKWWQEHTADTCTPGKECFPINQN